METCLGIFSIRCAPFSIHQPTLVLVQSNEPTLQSIEVFCTNAGQNPVLQQKSGMKALFFWLSFVLLSNLTWAQVQVIGQIQEPSGQVLPFATVILRQVRDSSFFQGTNSDSTGRFMLTNLQVGVYQLSVSAIGFESTTQPLEILTNSPSPLLLGPIQMKLLVNQLADVTIRAAAPLIRMSGDKIILSPNGSISGASGTVLDLLQQAPGVAIDLASAQIIMRGKEGVSLWVNGKALYLSPGEVGLYLQNLSVNMVESIEIIPSPPSSQDAMGNAGIINIRLRRSEQETYSGRVLLGLAYGRRFKTNTAFSLNTRQRKLSTFLNVEHNFNPQYLPTDFRRVLQAESPRRDLWQINLFDQKNRSFPLSAGVNWKWNAQENLDVFVSYSGQFNDWIENNRADYLNDTRVDTSLVFVNHSDLNTQRWFANLSYRREMDTLGTVFSTDLDGVRNTSIDDLTFTGEYLYATDGTMRSALFSANYQLRGQVLALRHDLKMPLSPQTSVEIGLKNTWIQQESIPFFEQSIAGVTTLPAERNLIFDYQEWVKAVYVNWKQKIGSTMVLESGLRAEHTNSNANNQSQSENLRRNYLDLFPFLSFATSFFNKSNLRLSLSKRIDRPNYSTLNPNIRMRTPLIIAKGNPLVQPQYTYTLDLSVSKGAFLINAGYHYIRDKVQAVQTLTPGTDVATAYLINTDKYHGFFVNLNIPVSLSSKWSWSNNFSLNQQQTQFSLEGQIFYNERLNYRVNSNSNYRFNSRWSAEWNLQYDGPFIDGIFAYKPRWQMGLGFQLSREQWVARVQLSDVFHTYTARYYANFNGFNTFNIVDFETRVLRLNWTYHFGKLKSGSSRKGSEEELIRRL